MLSVMAKEELANRIKATSLEEKEIIVKLLPSEMLEDELQRRRASSIMVLSSVYDILGRIGENSTLEELQDNISCLRNTLKVAE